MTAENWVDLGLKVLAESGIDAVRIESLARKLHISKGSFYWHFRARPELLSAMLISWRRKATLSIIDRQEHADVNALERLRQLVDLPVRSRRTSKGAALEMAIRLWAKSDAQAAQAIEEVDEVRVRHIQSLVRETFTGAVASVEARAFLIYAYMLAEAFVSAPLSASAKSECERLLGTGL